MRYIYFMLLCICCQPAKAQDFCKLIKTEISTDKITSEYNSPYDPEDKTAAHVTRNISKDPENGYDNFYIFLQMIGELDNVYEKTPTGGLKEKDEKNLVIEFEDKTMINDDTVKVNHDFTEDRTQATRYAHYPLTENNLKDFTTKKIVKFKLAGDEQLHPKKTQPIQSCIIFFA